MRKLTSLLLLLSLIPSVWAQIPNEFGQNPDNEKIIYLKNTPSLVQPSASKTFSDEEPDGLTMFTQDSSDGLLYCFFIPPNIFVVEKFSDINENINSFGIGHKGVWVRWFDNESETFKTKHIYDSNIVNPDFTYSGNSYGGKFGINGHIVVAMPKAGSPDNDDDRRYTFKKFNGSSTSTVPALKDEVEGMVEGVSPTGEFVGISGEKEPERYYKDYYPQRYPTFGEADSTKFLSQTGYHLQHPRQLVPSWSEDNEYFVVQTADSEGTEDGYWAYENNKLMQKVQKVDTYRDFVAARKFGVIMVGDESFIYNTTDFGEKQEITWDAGWSDYKSVRHNGSYITNSGEIYSAGMFGCFKDWYECELRITYIGNEVYNRYNTLFVRDTCDTLEDGLVELPFSNSSVEGMTGTIQFEYEHPNAITYIPLGTGTSDGLPITSYLTQNVDVVRNEYWLHSSGDERGNFFHHSLDARAEHALIIDEDAEMIPVELRFKENFVKNVVIVRPTGARVVFDFDYDEDEDIWSETGIPIGLNKGKDYLLRDLTPTDNTDFSYEMMFPSGISHIFDKDDGKIIKVKNIKTGAEVVIGGGTNKLKDLVVDLDGNSAQSAAFDVSLTWKDKRIDKVTYQSRLDDAEVVVDLKHNIGTTRVEKLIKSGDVPNVVLDYKKDEIDRGYGYLVKRVILDPDTREQKITLEKSGELVRETTTEKFKSGYTKSVKLKTADGEETNTATEYTGDSTVFTNGMKKENKIKERIVNRDGGQIKTEYDYNQHGWVDSIKTPFADGEKETKFTYEVAGMPGDVADEYRLVEIPRKTEVYHKGSLSSRTFTKVTETGPYYLEGYEGTSILTNWDDANALVTKSAPVGRPYQSGVSMPTGGEGALAGVIDAPAGMIIYTTEIRSAFLIKANRSYTLGPNDSTLISSKKLETNGFGNVIEDETKREGIVVDGFYASVIEDFGRYSSTDYSDGFDAVSSDWTYFGPRTIEGRDGVEVKVTYTEEGYRDSSTKHGIKTETVPDVQLRPEKISAFDTKGRKFKEMSYGYDIHDREVSETEKIFTSESTRTLKKVNTYSYNGTHWVKTIDLPNTPNNTSSADIVEKYYADGLLFERTGTATIDEQYSYSYVAGKGLCVEKKNKTDQGVWVTVSKTYSNARGQPHRWERGGLITTAATQTFDSMGRKDLYCGFAGDEWRTEYHTSKGYVNKICNIIDSGPDREWTISESFKNDGGMGTDVYERVVTAPGAAPVTTKSSVKSGGGADIMNWTSFNGLTSKDNTNVNTSTGLIQNFSIATDGTKIMRNFEKGAQMVEQGMTVSNSMLWNQNVEKLNDLNFPEDIQDFRTNQRIRLLEYANYGVPTKRIAPHEYMHTRTDKIKLNDRFEVIEHELNNDTSTKTELTRDNRGNPTQTMNGTKGGSINTAMEFSSQNYPNVLKSPYGTNSDPEAGVETVWDIDEGSGLVTQKRLIKLDGTSVTLESYGYKNNGLFETLTRQDGTTVTYSYNQDTLALEGKNYSGGKNYTMTRKSDGQLESISYDGKTVNYGYDNFKGINSESIPHISSDTKIEIDRDTKGRREFMRVIKGQNTLLTYQYIYNSETGRLDEVKNVSLGHSYGYTYHPWAQESTKKISYKDSTDTEVIKVEKGIGALTDVLTENVVTKVSGGVLLAKTSYSDRDERNRITEIKKEQPNILPDELTYDINYDQFSQIKSATGWMAGKNVLTRNYNFNFDAIGKPEESTTNDFNQITVRVNDNEITVQGRADLEANVTVNEESVTRDGELFHAAFTVDNSAGPVVFDLDVVAVQFDDVNEEDRLDTVSGSVLVPQASDSHSYDSRGNMDEDAQYDYIYNAEDQLIEVVSKIDSGTGLAYNPKGRVVNEYDHIGRRIEKKSYEHDGTSWNLVSTRKFLYDGWNLLAEFDGSGTLLKSYTWGKDLSETVGGSGGIGGLLSYTDHTSSKTYYAYGDGRGNIVGYADADTGDEVAAFEYGVFGNVVGCFAEDDNIQQYSFTYQSKYTDHEVGLVYFGLRFYDPAKKSWLTRDPEGEIGSGSPNLYVYCFNDPINYIDALGGAPTPAEIHKKAAQAEDQLALVRSLAGKEGAQDAFDEYFELYKELNIMSTQLLEANLGFFSYFSSAERAAIARVEKLPVGTQLSRPSYSQLVAAKNIGNDLGKAAQGVADNAGTQLAVTRGVRNTSAVIVVGGAIYLSGGTLIPIVKGVGVKGAALYTAGKGKAAMLYVAAQSKAGAVLTKINTEALIFYYGNGFQKLKNAGLFTLGLFADGPTAANPKFKTLNIGSGDNALRNAVNIDIRRGVKGVDVVADANLLPYADEAFENIVSQNPRFKLLESDVLRTLESGGQLSVIGNMSNKFFKEIFNSDPAKYGLKIIEKGIGNDNLKFGEMKHTTGEIINSEAVDKMKSIIFQKL